MAIPLNIKRAEALEDAVKVVKHNLILRSADLSPTKIKLLQQADLAYRICKGYFCLCKESGKNGETLMNGVAYWPFVDVLLSDRLGDSYCLPPLISLDLHTGIETPPKRLVVINRTHGNYPINIRSGGEIFMYRQPPLKKKSAKNSILEGPSTIFKSPLGVNLWPLEEAIREISPTVFYENPFRIQLALRMTEINRVVRAVSREPVNLQAASRLIGGYGSLGWVNYSRQIRETLEGQGYTVPAGPQVLPRIQCSPLAISPRAERLKSMWAEMREKILPLEPEFPKMGRITAEAYAAHADKIYVYDAYHSLSIEGYQVTLELIQRVRDGLWDPYNLEEDRKELNKMAAKGYHTCFKSVVRDIQEIIKGRDSGELLKEKLSSWHIDLFSESVINGFLSKEDLAGYRARQVIIQGSRHAPPAKDAVPDCMDIFFDLIANEESAVVRAVLGHFIFTYIHPYSDGNGRLGRFIMNSMLAGGDMPWSVIRVDDRKEYMAALEKASVESDITLFAHFVKATVQRSHHEFMKDEAPPIPLSKS